MTDKKPSYYAVIPADVRLDTTLTPNAKLLYGEITARKYNYGIVTVMDKLKFAEYYNVSRRSISILLDLLIDKGYITITKGNDKEIFNKLNRLNDRSGGCLFCGYRKSFAHKHHYPIRKADGGTETISICPNCHSEFHLLADVGREIQVVNKKHVEVYNV